MLHLHHQTMARTLAAAVFALAILAPWHGGFAASRSVRGEDLFRTHCSVCHSIGHEPEGALDPPSIGPNLLNVDQRRERPWLERWLREPDRVLADRDPQAMAMLAQFDYVRMPNLHLDDGEIQALLAFIDGESSRIMRHHKPGTLVQEVSQ